MYKRIALLIVFPLLVLLALAGCNESSSPAVQVGSETGIGNLRQVITERSFESFPSWSRDGENLYFVSDRFGGTAICKIKASGGGGVSAVTQAPTGADADLNPDVHPRIEEDVLFASTRARGVPQIFTIKQGGRGLTQLTTMAKGALDPSWSPDGQVVAFSSPDKDGRWYVWIMANDGTNLRQITPGIQPRWSPDGGRLVFAKESPSEKSSNWDIYTINVDGSGLTQITAEDSHEFYPDWSPEGNWICYCSVAERVRVPTEFKGLIAEFGKQRNFEIWVKNIEASGRGAVQLTYTTGRDTCPRWSPDGKQIAFASDRGGSMDIWCMTPNVITGGSSPK